MSLDDLPLSPLARSRLLQLGYRHAAELAAVAATDAGRAALAAALDIEGPLWSALAPLTPKASGGLGSLGLDLDALERHSAKARPWRAGPELRALPVPPAATMSALADVPARHQGPRGTCVAFAACTALALSRGGGEVLSPQFLYWHLKRMAGFPQSDGSFARVALDVLEEVGTCTEATFPYDPTPYEDEGLPVEGSEPTAQATAEARLRRTGRGLLYSTVWWYPGVDDHWGALAAWLDALVAEDERPELDGLHLCRAALSGALGPPPRALIGSFRVFKSSFAAARVTGRMTLPLPDEPRAGGHAMAIVGYADDADWAGGGYLLIRNSWGAGWPLASEDGPGLCRMPYAYAAGHMVEAGVVVLPGDVLRGVAVEAASASAGCPRCGAAVGSAARFCGSCGAPLVREAPVPETPGAALRARHAERLSALRGRLGSPGRGRCVHCGRLPVGRCRSHPSGEHEPGP